MYNSWQALLDEFEPQTEISLIELLSEFHRNKSTDSRSNVTVWMSTLELQHQGLKVMGCHIADDHLIIMYWEFTERVCCYDDTAVPGIG